MKVAVELQIYGIEQLSEKSSETSCSSLSQVSLESENVSNCKNNLKNNEKNKDTKNVTTTKTISDQKVCEKVSNGDSTNFDELNKASANALKTSIKYIIWSGRYKSKFYIFFFVFLLLLKLFQIKKWLVLFQKCFIYVVYSNYYIFLRKIWYFHYNIS